MEKQLKNFSEGDPRPDIKELLSGLREYNDYFNWGAVAAREIINPYKDANETGSAKEEELQREKFENLNEKYKNVLETTGLSLEQVDSPFVMVGLSSMSKEEIQRRVKSFSETTGITQEDLSDPDSYEAKRAKQFMNDLHAEASAPTRLTEMRLNVSDAEKFLSYLNSLQSSEILPEEKESLKAIAGILEKQFIGQYDVTDPNDNRFLTLIGSLGKIIASYEELGIGKSVETLKALLAVTRKKYLKEFLLVNQKQYLAPHDQGFGPARWHKDITPDSYNARWDEAINIYRKTLSNPNAKEFSEKLRTHLLEAIEIAKRDIESKPGKRDDFPEFLKTLARTKRDLA